MNCKKCINCEVIEYTDHTANIYECRQANIVLSNQQILEGCNCFENDFIFDDLGKNPVIKMLSDEELEDDKSLAGVWGTQRDCTNINQCRGCNGCNELEVKTDAN